MKSFFDNNNSNDKPLTPIKPGLNFYTPSDLIDDINARVDEEVDSNTMINWINDGIAMVNSLYDLNLPWVAQKSNAKTIIAPGFVDWNSPYIALERNIFFNLLCDYCIFCYYFKDQDDLTNIQLSFQQTKTETLYAFSKRIPLIDDKYKLDLMARDSKYYTRNNNA